MVFVVFLAKVPFTHCIIFFNLVPVDLRTKQHCEYEGFDARMGSLGRKVILLLDEHLISQLYLGFNRLLMNVVYF
jgi:hypothetical protein